MPVAVEYVLVALIVGAALFALGRRLVRFVTGAEGGCGSSCGRCESNGKAIKEGSLKPLVTLDLSPRDERVK